MYYQLKVEGKLIVAYFRQMNRLGQLADNILLHFYVVGSF